jgi:hypothetical protein
MSISKDHSTSKVENFVLVFNLIKDPFQMKLSTRRSVISVLLRIRKRLIYFEYLVTKSQSLGRHIRSRTPIVQVVKIFIDRLVPPIHTDEGVFCAALLQLFFHHLPQLKTYGELFAFQRAFFYKHIVMLGSVSGELGFVVSKH